MRRARVKDISYGELQTGSKPSPRERFILQAASIEEESQLSPPTLDKGTARLEVCSSGYQSFLGPILPHCGLVTPSWHDRAYSAPLYVGNLQFVF